MYTISKVTWGPMSNMYTRSKVTWGPMSNMYTRSKVIWGSRVICLNDLRLIGDPK